MLPKLIVNPQRSFYKNSQQSLIHLALFLLKNIKQMNEYNKTETDTENKLVVTSGTRVAGRGKIGEGD